MRRVLALFACVLIGCKAGRQAAVSDDGRVASTTEAGTFVSGRGKIAEGGDALTWSPDGETLAIGAQDGVVLWPTNRRLKELHRPLAFSPFGDRIAGTMDGKIRVIDVATGAPTTTTLAGEVSALRWTSDGRLFAVDRTGVRIDDGPQTTLKTDSILDAVATADGRIAMLTWASMPQNLAQTTTTALRFGTWNPVDGSLNFASIARPDSTFGAPSPRRLLLPLAFALAPGGRQFAAAGLKIESGARTITRLLAIAGKKSPTNIENKEAQLLLDAARITYVVVKGDPTGRTDTLWSSPTSAKEIAPTELAFSPDGKWLAIARKDGTVRIATNL